MKVSELRNQSDEELAQSLARFRRDLAELRVRRGQGEDPDQPMKMHYLRKDVARAETILRERELQND